MLTTVEKYFNLSAEQKHLLQRYVDLLWDWNQKINLISRQQTLNDIWINHVLHSLAIGKIVNFSGAKVVDVGSGGGLPGVPLAILFPQAHFTLIDSIGKKVLALDDIVHSLNLENVSVLQVHSKELKDKFDFVVARAVTELPKFYKQTKHLIRPGNDFAFPNGIFYLKGGDLDKEIAPFADKVRIFELSKWIDHPFFATKKLIYLPKLS